MASFEQQTPPAPAPAFPYSMPEEEEKNLRRIFAAFDENGDGRLTADEMHRSLLDLGINAPLCDLQSSVLHFSGGGDTLDFQAFQDLYRTLPGRQRQVPGPPPYHRQPKDEDNGVDLAENDANRAENEPNRAENELDQPGQSTLGPYAAGNDVNGAESEENEEDKKIFAAFQIFDRNHNGFVTADELQIVLSRLGYEEVKDLADCERLIAKVDINKDGQVSFSEYRSMVDKLKNLKRKPL